MLTDNRCKQLMNELGMPDSKSLYGALHQVANETEQAVRAEARAEEKERQKCAGGAGAAWELVAMSIDDAIVHAKQMASETKCGMEHRQLANWLIELKAFKEAPCAEELESAVEAEAQEPVELCGAPAVGGLCCLPAGHNRGNLDIPRNHKAAPQPPALCPDEYERGKEDGWKACETCHGIVDGKHTRSVALQAKVAEQSALIEKCEKALRDVESLMDESTGVAGLHLNGDIAPWSDLREQGRYETWLQSLDEALAAIAANKP